MSASSISNRPDCPFTTVVIDCDRIVDSTSFHDVFAETFGFPWYYGRNMDAWIDCMTSLDDPEDELTAIHAPAGGVVVLELIHRKEFASRCPELYADLVECTAFVNWRRMEIGLGPVLCLSFM